MSARQHSDKGRVMVTGGARGIGRALATALVATGYEVVATCRDPAAAEPLPAGGRFAALELRDPASIASLAAAEADGLVALVNNAGSGALGSLETFPLPRARELLEINLLGSIDLTQRLLPQLRAAGGCIVNVGSLIADYPVPYHALYAATKAALRGYTLALRAELLPLGVQVTLVEPGDVHTDHQPLVAGAGPAVYDQPFRTVLAARADKMAHATDPAQVAARIVAVIGSRRPPPIVAAGGAAPLLRFLRRLLPDRLAELLTRRSYGL